MFTSGDKNKDFIQLLFTIVKFSIVKYWFDAPIDAITFMVARLMFTQIVYVSDKNEDFIQVLFL